MYEKDQLDWIGTPFNTLPPEALETLKQQEGYSCLQTGGVACFFLNSKVSPFHNKKMRQAFSYAIDRKAIVDHILGENVLPAYGAISPFFALGNAACFEE
ncbi:MAG: ABC transporter substrate-binding protein [Simkaniaceae bacterium]|nr:ABC transporter substrate-binding protein [Simkaniaceae bacterium]